jgi:hypothetical protein
MPRRIPPADQTPGQIPPAVDFTDRGVPNRARKKVVEEPDPDEEEEEEEERPAPSFTPPKKKAVFQDEEAEFITDADVKKTKVSTTPTTDKHPMEAGFVVDMVSGLGQKIHETEHGLTGHPVFIHTEADEKIWRGLGRYVESMVDPAKYGVVILLVVLVGSELLKLGIWAADDAKAKRAPKPKEKRK